MLKLILMKSCVEELQRPANARSLLFSIKSSMNESSVKIKNISENVTLHTLNSLICNSVRVRNHEPESITKHALPGAKTSQNSLRFLRTTRAVRTIFISYF